MSAIVARVALYYGAAYVSEQIVKKSLYYSGVYIKNRIMSGIWCFIYGKEEEEEEVMKT